MKKQKVVRSYSPNCTRDAEELTEALKNGYQFVRASEFIPPQGNKVGYIEYIVEKNEDSPEEEKLRQELKASRNVQEALRKELGEVIAEKESLEALIQTITNLPPAAPTQKWIPVSERLPKKFEFVNCTCHSLIDDREDWVVETVYIPQPSDSPYSDWGNIPMLNEGNCEVVAWIHRDIPEPYKAEMESEE